MIDLKEIKEAIKQIDVEDNECAHIREDNLYLEFIDLVSKCDDINLSEMAKELLKTQDMAFSRWYA